MNKIYRNKQTFKDKLAYLMSVAIWWHKYELQLLCCNAYLALVQSGFESPAGHIWSMGRRLPTSELLLGLSELLLL